MKLKIDPHMFRGAPYLEVNWGWRIFVISLHWQFKFAHDYTWYDGPHRCIDAGPIGIYMNW